MIKEAYIAGEEAALEKVGKLRGRALRELRTFLAQNKSYGGHATNQSSLKKILDDGKIYSAKDTYDIKGSLPTGGERRTAYKNASPDTISKLQSSVSMYPDGLPFVKAHPMAKSQAEPVGFGHHGVIVPTKPHHEGVAKTYANQREIRSGVPVDTNKGLFVAPKETINKLRQENKGKTFLSREDLKKSYPDLFQEYRYAGPKTGSI